MKMTTKITEHNCSDILDAIGDTLLQEYLNKKVEIKIVLKQKRKKPLRIKSYNCSKCKCITCDSPINIYLKNLGGL